MEQQTEGGYLALEFLVPQPEAYKDVPLSLSRQILSLQQCNAYY